MERHVNLIAILWIVFGSLSFFLGFFVFSLLFGLSFIPDISEEAPAILRIVGGSVGLFFALLALPDIVGGIGLLKKKEWGRILILVLSFFSLINFPLGTALGIYSFVILTKEETVVFFKS